MLHKFAQNAAAFTILAAIWFGWVAFLPRDLQAQTTSSTKDESKSKKDKNKSKDAAPAPTPAPTAPLSVKEDPSQIGKRNINTGADKFFGWLGGSKEKEMQLGRQLAMEVEQQSKMVDDPEITEYVNRVGQNLVLHSDAKVPFTIKVIDSDEVNAFALPGGFFFVNKGLLLAADNEAELAGVMAHEIAHVAARHAMENQGKGTLINYGALAGMIFGGAIVSGILQNGGGILAGLAELKFSRAAEEEADRLGVQYLYAAGYDPHAMSTMFEKLAAQNKKKPGAVAKLFSTHPQSLDRRDASEALVARFPDHEEYLISTSEFQRIKADLLRKTNALASVSTDSNDPMDNSRPTLKKRQPTTDGDGGTSDNSSGSSSSSSDGPPKLKKHEPEPVPTPTPTFE
ncbi:MAG: M48 family metalloprotease [Acidobacteria bacterium]|nr:M48 family metalloprotease [Acidobacteriota bacterium]